MSLGKSLLLGLEETLSDPGQERAINSRILDCRRWAGKCNFPISCFLHPTNQANGLIPSVPIPLDVVLINRRAGLVPRHYRIRRSVINPTPNITP